LIGLACVFWLHGLAVGGEERPAETASDSAKLENSAAERARAEKLRFFRERLQTTKLVLASQPDRALELVAEPLSRFDNPVSGIADGFTFLWTDRGRPAAFLKSYYNTPRGSWGRTYISLASGPLELVSAEGVKLWTPAKAGVRWAPLADAPSPAATAGVRLRQMRDLAREFEIIDHWGLKDPTDWQLRLLPAPLYRYEARDQQVVDGAIFGYVLTTSPEALLLLEVRETPEGSEWHYATSRATRFELNFSRNGRPEAEYPRLDAWPSGGTYFHVPVEMTGYPFKAAAGEAKAGAR
jgi:hypothetical protein